MVRSKYFIYLKKKEKRRRSCFERLPGQEAKAESVIWRFGMRFRTAVCCTERQIEAMLLTLISVGGENLEHFKKISKERSGESRFGKKHCHTTQHRKPSRPHTGTSSTETSSVLHHINTHTHSLH